MFSCCATYRWKALNEGYNFSLDLISIEALNAKLWGPKVMKVPTLRIFRLPFGSPGTKCHLDVSLMESIMNPNFPMAHPNTKNAPTMH